MSERIQLYLELEGSNLLITKTKPEISPPNPNQANNLSKNPHRPPWKMHNRTNIFHSCEDIILFPRKLRSLSTLNTLRQKIQSLMDLMQISRAVGANLTISSGLYLILLWNAISVPIIDCCVSIKWLLVPDQELLCRRYVKDSCLVNQEVNWRVFMSEHFKWAWILNRELEKLPVQRCTEVPVACWGWVWEGIAWSIQIARNGSNSVSDLFPLSHSYQFFVCMTEYLPYCQSPGVLLKREASQTC